MGSRSGPQALTNTQRDSRSIVQVQVSAERVDITGESEADAGKWRWGKMKYQVF